MYRLESFGAAGAIVTNDAFPYQSTFRADNAAQAELIVVGLNQQVMLTELAQVRFEIETTVLELDDGLRLQTDRESRAELFSTYRNLMDGLIPDTHWKAANGWKMVTFNDMKPMARAMAAHVRGCYSGEGAVAIAIGNVTTMAQIEAINVRGQFTEAYQAAFDEIMAAGAVA